MSGISKRTTTERLIIAKTLIEGVLEELPSAQPELSDEEKRLYKQLRSYHNGSYAKLLDKLMTSAQPERKKGKWILTEDDDYEYCTCSECGYQNGENWMNGSDIPFCAMCGADMRGEQDE